MSILTQIHLENLSHPIFHAVIGSADDGRLFQLLPSLRMHPIVRTPCSTQENYEDPEARH